MPIHKRTGVLWRSRRVESGQANGGQADSTIDDCDFDAKQWLSRHLMDSVQRTKTFDSAQWADDKALKALETIMGRPVISRLLNRVHHSALDLDELVDDLVSFAEKTFFPGENVIYNDREDGVPDGKSNCVVHSSIASNRYNINVDGSYLVGVSARCLRRCHPLSSNDVRHLVLLTCSRQMDSNNKKGAAKSEAKKDTWLVDDEQKEKFGIHDRLVPISHKAQRTDQDMASTPSSAQLEKEEVKKREKKKKVAEQKKQNGEGAEKRRLIDKENGREEEAGEEAENEEEPATKKDWKKTAKKELPTVDKKNRMNGGAAEPDLAATLEQLSEEEDGNGEEEPAKKAEKKAANAKTAAKTNGPEKKKRGKKRRSGGAEPEIAMVEDEEKAEEEEDTGQREKMRKGRGKKRSGEKIEENARKKAERSMEHNNQDAMPKKTGKKETAEKENGTKKKKEKKRLSEEAEAEVAIVEEEKKGQGEQKANGKSKKRSGERMEENGKTEEQTTKKDDSEDEYQEEHSDERIRTTPLQLAGAVAMTSPYFPDALMLSQFFLAHRAHLHVPRLYHIPQAEKLLLVIDSPALSDTVLLPLVIGMLKAIAKSPEYETIVAYQQCIGRLEVNEFTWLQILLAVIRGERAHEMEHDGVGMDESAPPRAAPSKSQLAEYEEAKLAELAEEAQAYIEAGPDTRSRLQIRLEEASGRSFGTLLKDIQMSVLVLLVNRALDCLPVAVNRTSDEKRELVKHRHELAEKLRPLKTERDAVREECARLEKAGRVLSRVLRGKLSKLEHACLSTEEELQSVIDEVNELEEKESQTARVECLGVDRHGRRFYVFPKSATGLFMHVTEYYEWHVDEDGTAQPELIRDEETFECICSEADILGAVKLLEKGTTEEKRLAKAIQLQLSAGAFNPLDDEEEKISKRQKGTVQTNLKNSQWWLQKIKRELISLANDLNEKELFWKKKGNTLPKSDIEGIAKKDSLEGLKKVVVRLAFSLGLDHGPFIVYDPKFPCPFSPRVLVKNVQDAEKESVLYFLVQVFRSRVQWEYTEEEEEESNETEDDDEEDDEITKMINRIQQSRLYKTLRGLEVDGVWRLEELFDKAKEMGAERFKRRLGKMMLAWREHFEEFLPRKLEQFNDLEEEFDL